MGNDRSIASLQKQIEHSNMLRILKEEIKGKINERFNLELREIYEEMLVKSKNVPPSELNRFLLRIRQKSDGYVVKGGYVSFEIINPRRSARCDLSCNLGGVWNGLMSPLKVDGDTPWKKSYQTPITMLEEQRKIVAAFMPHVRDTCTLIKDCWEVLIHSNKDCYEAYHNIATIMATVVHVDVAM